MKQFDNKQKKIPAVLIASLDFFLHFFSWKCPLSGLIDWYVNGHIVTNVMVFETWKRASIVTGANQKSFVTQKVTMR